MKEKILKEIERIDIKYKLKENEKFNNKNGLGKMEEDNNKLYFNCNESDCLINEDIIEEYEEEIFEILEKNNVDIIC